MENLLLIEIFKNEIKCICKTKLDSVECDFTISDEIESNLSKIDPNLLISIYGILNDDGEVFFQDNTLMVDIYDCENKVRKSIVAISLDDLIEKLTTIKFESVCRETFPIDKYRKIVFEKELFMLILTFTQQFFWYNNIELEKKIDLRVITPSGMQKLISNGSSMCVMEPIIGLDGYEGIEMISVDDGFLRATNLNNCTTCISFSSGDYYLSLEVTDPDGKMDTIYVIRNYNEFWESIRVCLNNDDVYFVLTKEI